MNITKKNCSSPVPSQLHRHPIFLMACSRYLFASTEYFFRSITAPSSKNSSDEASPLRTRSYKYHETITEHHQFKVSCIKRRSNGSRIIMCPVLSKLINNEQHTNILVLETHRSVVVCTCKSFAADSSSRRTRT